VELNDLKARARLAALAQTIALLLAAIAGVLAYPLLTHATPASGVFAPDFALKDSDGRNQRLSEYRGDVVVMTFWASWCGPCRESLAGIDRVVNELGDPSAVALTVNLDGDAGRASAVAQSLGLGRAPLVDAKQGVGRLYDVGQLPLTLLIDREGVVQQAWVEDPPARDALVQAIRELSP
jgi:peroxiredoxin